MATDNKYVSSAASAANPNTYVSSSYFANKADPTNRYVPSSTYADIAAEGTGQVPGLTDTNLTAGSYIPSSAFADIADRGIPTGPTGPTGPVVDTNATATSTNATGPVTATLPPIPAPATISDAQVKRQSAYDLLFEQFNKYGLGSLVAPLKGLIMENVPASEFVIKLRESEPYRKRFAANAERIAKGLTPLDEATYLAKEDAYQNVMRQYGLPESYWKRDALGTQDGFTKLIANDVSADELGYRIGQAANILDNSPTEYLDAIKKFYPEIQRGDLMAYVLDPANAKNQIETKINAAKIGGEYLRGGLGTSQGTAEDLLRQGVTAEQARKGVQAINEIAPRGGQLAAMYGQGPYGQSDVEAEVYGLGGATEAKKKRERLAGLETAAFSGKSGVGVLGNPSAGSY